MRRVIELIGVSDGLVVCLLECGWDLEAIRYDTTTVPPTPRYVMEKDDEPPSDTDAPR